MIFIWEYQSKGIINYSKRLYSKRLRQGQVVKDKNEEDYSRYFETIILGNNH
jgi:hypothetical protein